MAFALPDTIQKLITSPPGQLVAGSVLAGIVWKFFEKVEKVLSEQTKHEIAVWLREANTAKQINTWPQLLNKVFDRTFGLKYLSLKTFSRSCMASFASSGFAWAVLALGHGKILPIAFLKEAPFYQNRYAAARLLFSITILLALWVVGNVFPDYISLLKTRYILGRMRVTGIRGRSVWLLADLALTCASGLVSLFIGACLFYVAANWDPSFARFVGYWHTILMDLHFFPSQLWQSRTLLAPFRALWFYPAFFPSVWLWLYAGSGFLLKAARRFDVGFQWFNSKIDIEKHPLSAIGLVAGSLVAVLYWGFAAVAHFVR